MNANSKTLLCCITVPDVDKAVQKMSTDYAKSVTEAVQGHGFSAKVREDVGKMCELWGHQEGPLKWPMDLYLHFVQN